ncbi:RNA-binding protein [Vermiphilus pyriformis]|jgi:RNA recognition motif-containing protein|uniref:RRM domain-containing protein n=1 Tax=candidate division TM6 bacterium JCVI TM6SC1 TaxID=1306947 RepID=A0A0D2JER2_9BACT|nr:hypothetical protein J120_01060 [candidate division TM6 bacterium JCVI TM6SC1]UNE35797.1 MAG: RNA-binding protein [Vermiphilus pyriformis]
MINIYVGNLHPSVTEEQIKGLFEQFGNITSIKLIKDRFTNQSRGFAFVQMSTDDEAQDAIAGLNGAELEGRSLRINEARPQEQRPRREGGYSSGGPRSSNGGGFERRRPMGSGGSRFGGGSDRGGFGGGSDRGGFGNDRSGGGWGR